MDQGRIIWRFADMILYENRLKTLQSWPIDYIDKAKVARSGLYFTAYKRRDSVECFVCNVGIGGWEVGDDPDTEHKRLSPNCDYYKRHDLVIDYSPKHIEFSSIKLRYLTYKEWPTNLNQKPVDLLSAGFFYKNIGDRVTCYYCGLSLNRWLPSDDPWKEHAFHSRNCGFLLVMKGHEYISKVQAEHRPAEMPMVTQHSEINNQSADTSQFRPEDRCSICMDVNKCIIFIPCGHLAACAKCSMTCQFCPICRNNYTDAVRMIYSNSTSPASLDNECD